MIILIIAFQVGKGYRLGDPFANTRVVWRKYAHLPMFGGDALVCSGCGYNLMGNVSGVCPECGSIST
jgi:rubrerythrin